MKSIMQAGLDAQAEIAAGAEPVQTINRHMRAIIDETPLSSSEAALVPQQVTTAILPEDWLYYHLMRALECRRKLASPGFHISELAYWHRERHLALGQALLHYHRIEAEGRALPMLLAQLWYAETRP